MQIPGRTYTSGNNSYRYSINGQEKTPEIAPNTTTALFWEYDARIARRWNVDPVYKHSPYSAFGGNPVWFSDPLGLDTVTNWNQAKTGDVWGHQQGKSTFYYTYNGKSWESSGSVSEMEAEVRVTTSRKKITNSTNAEFAGWGEVRDIEVNLLDRKISSLEKNINGISQSDRVGSLNLHVERLQEKHVGLLIAKKGLESINTAIDIWDVGVGLHAYATKGGDADIFSPIPLIGGFFSASNDMIEENERMIVNFSLQQGYSNFYQMLTGSAVGRKSGLTGVYISKNVLQTVVSQGFLDLHIPQIGKSGPTDMNGNKYDYFLVFPANSGDKVTKFIPLKIE